MEIKQLTYFIAILRSGSILKASATLGIGQPALSRQLRQLEEEVGVPLIYRHGRGINPTEEGARFAQAVEPLLEGLEQARAELSWMRGVPTGEIKLGLPPSLSAAMGARLIRDFMTRFPQAKLHIVAGFSGFVNEWLVEGSVDIAVLNGARRVPSMHMDPLMTVDLFLVGRLDDMTKLTSDPRTVKSSCLKGLPLILPGRHHGLRRELDATVAKLGFDLNTIVEVDSLPTIRELLHAGIGMTVLPLGAILPDVTGDATIAVRRLVEPAVTQSFFIACSLHRPLTPGVRELARSIRAHVAAALEDGRLAGRLASDPRAGRSARRPGEALRKMPEPDLA